ncbi:MAG: extracellular solute-binding protein [Dehalococcoidia bacterium]|nr:extracellular solute-binding protein [Dehalococcoidia bacterium]
MKPKNLICLGLAAVAALGILACGGDDDDDDENGATAVEGAQDPTPQDDASPESTEPEEGDEDEGQDNQAESACPIGALDEAGEPVSITFWHAMTASNEETLSELVGEFNAAQDRVEVELIFQGTYNETIDKYLTALRSGGDLPDIVQLEETTLRLMIDSQSALPVQECIDAEDYDLSDYAERVLAYFTVEDQIWPMPFSISNPVLLYNRNDFEAAGLDPDSPPLTLDELRQAAQAIVDSGAAEYGMSLDTQAGYIEQLFALAGVDFANSANGRDGRATEVLIESETGLEIFSWLGGMVQDGLALDVGRNPSNADQLLAVGAGQAGMALATSASLGSVFDILETGQFPDIEPGVGPMPSLPGEGGILVSGSALWISNRSTPAEQEAAWELAKFLGEPQSQATWHVGTGYIPIRVSAADLPEVEALWAERPHFRVAYDQLLDGVTNVASSGPVMGAYIEVREAVVSAMEAMFLEGASPEDALAAAAAEANEAIEDYNSRVGG